MKPLQILPYGVIGPYFDQLISYKSYRFGQVIIPFPKLKRPVEVHDLE